MSRRRFLILVCAVVSVNSFFWLAQGSFALPRGLVDRFFGPDMIRSEVIVAGRLGGVNDFRLDRGVITTIVPRMLTLRERDGTVVSIPVVRRAKIVGSPSVTDVSQLRPGMRILVVRQANAPAHLIRVEGG
jgi:hypothetical protein